jgi:gamma-glutamylputrescine oxidase
MKWHAGSPGVKRRDPDSKLPAQRLVQHDRPMSGEFPQGYYAASAAPRPDRVPLSGVVRSDFCVVGAGFTGLNAALALAEAGARVIVVEAEQVGFAASGRNGGQIHTGVRKTQAELEVWLGPLHARDLWNLSDESKSLLCDRIAEHDIACDLKHGLVIAAHDRAALRELSQDTEHLSAAYGYRARMMDATKTAEQLGTDVYPGARWDGGGGHLHPLKYARGLAAAAETAGVQIFEHSQVQTLDEDKDRVNLRCANGTIAAGKVLLATDAFTGNIAPMLAPYIAHVESFVVATAPLSPELSARVLPLDAAVADTRHVLDYYRKSADHRMLYAGREAYWSAPKDIARLVRPRMAKVYPMLADAAIEFAWCGTVGITRTRMPHLGRLSERVLYAHGYSGQGVALANVGGVVMAEAALGQPERFDVFARVPAHKFPGGALLRKPLVAAALTGFKILDAL